MSIFIHPDAEYTPTIFDHAGISLHSHPIPTPAPHGPKPCNLVVAYIYPPFFAHPHLDSETHPLLYHSTARWEVAVQV